MYDALAGIRLAMRERAQRRRRDKRIVVYLSIMTACFVILSVLVIVDMAKFH